MTVDRMASWLTRRLAASRRPPSADLLCQLDADPFRAAD